MYCCLAYSLLFAKPIQSEHTNTLQLPSIFGDGMVLQQHDSVAFFGKAAAGQKVVVETSWGGTNSTNANANGKWRLNIKTPTASFDVQTVKVRTNRNTILFKNVLVGEVWLLSGQSNMAFRLRFDDNGEQAIANGKNSALRLFKVPSITSPKPEETIKDVAWQSCSSISLKDFSAVTYYFAKSLSASLPNIPIGLISAAYGSATIEAFMSKETLLSKDFLADHYHNYSSDKESKNPTWCYNAMIFPLQPYTIKGMVWYQGESNCVRASQYEEALKTMINAYRVAFENRDMPFHIVQIPPYNYSASQQEPGNTFSAAVLRDAQLQVTNTINNTGLVVTTDVGDVGDIHPTNKRPVGERLAQLALNQNYGQKDKVFSGPQYKSHTREGSTIRLSFDCVKNGIQETYEELNWFIIAGPDRKFYQGNAFVDGKDIVVSSPFVEEPKAVRFAWHNIAVPNFFNEEGLPASPFKTDDWINFTYSSNMTSWSTMPDIRNVPFDLVVPELTGETPAEGKRVKQTLPAYKGTKVYHTLYLPLNWEKGKAYPLIVEYSGNGPYVNKYGDANSGKVEDAYLGYGLSGGKDFIWIGMPFVSSNGQKNELYWWGDVEATVNYTMDVVKDVCEQFGGNKEQVFVAGFSRGAIACNYIGLHNDDIADLWRGFIAFSHYDGVREWSYPDSDKASAITRLKRLNGKPQLIIQENEGPRATKSYIEKSGIIGDFTFLTIPYRNHDARWVLQNIPERRELREWVNKVLNK